MSVELPMTNHRRNPDEQPQRPLVLPHLSSRALGIAVAEELKSRAIDSLYAVAGGNPQGGRADVARLSSAQRHSYFRSREFCDWVQAEKELGRRVLWLTDFDKCKAAGDSFSFFFHWRARQENFTGRQHAGMLQYLKESALISRGEFEALRQQAPSATAFRIVGLWKAAEQGGKHGLRGGDFWQHVYWPSQEGMTCEQKQCFSEAFAPEYAKYIFPGARAEHDALHDAGAEVVIVTNGDYDLVRAVAPLLGIKQTHAVGSIAMYDSSGHATGKMHTYEQYESNWAERPQVGKVLKFTWWLNNRQSQEGWTWDNVVVAGFDGDSATADGGPMLFLRPEIGNFMVDTPGAHDAARIKRFHAQAAKYGSLWRGRFVTLNYPEPKAGPFPE